jgi:CheY-like chemotaxis protein
MESSRALRRLISENIELAVIPAAERPFAEVDVHQLDQVLMNLAVNARDAIQERGTITIATENAQRLEDGRNRDYLAVCVTDDGSGIDPSIQDRIFNPFFTTKPMGKGTGLGLATVHGIVSQSGGRIEMESEVGRGTRFRVLLPVVTPDMNAATPDGPHAEPSRGETVLVVEDEAALRSAVRRMLQGAGYTVLEARHGEDALEVLEQHGGVDLLVTDVVMPQMGGRELASRVRGMFPDMPILFITGYTDDELLRKGSIEREAEVLRKPFISADLLSAVGRLLNRPA